MSESYVLEPCGQGHIKKITSKRELYIFNGGTSIHPGRGKICVKDFGFENDDYWMVRFMEYGGSSTGREFVHISNLSPLE